MQGVVNETVGAGFQIDLLQRARDLTLRVIEEAARKIGPGTSELDAKKIIQDIQTALGGEKNWHPPQIRFGVNSILGFGEKGEENVTLRSEDIYFLDLGPIFQGHEGDVGRAFALGSNPEHARCCRDVEAIWHEVRNHWSEHGVTGAQLYAFATEAAKKRGWELLISKANGHRIADFPHAAKARGSIEEFPSKPAPDRWILEIQIRHPSEKFGAFFEDILH